MLSCLAQTPRIVITDSQAFAPVAAIVPEDIPLTSFSILFARHKGDLIQAVRGAAALETVQDGDTILISEGCTHHRQCDDIGSVKLPRWIRGHTGKELRFVFSSGTEFPEDLSPYRLIVHCGGCMLNPRQMRYRPEMRRRTGCSHDQLRRADRPHTGYPSPCSGALSGRCRRFDRRPALSIVPVFQTQNSGTTAKKRTGRRGRQGRASRCFG